MTTINNNNNNNKFLTWFVGFCDAEANFQTTFVKRINKKGQLTSYGIKYGFYIGLHEQDKPLLEYIQQKLNNIGKIYEYPLKKECRYSIYTHDDLKWLIDNIFSKYPLFTIHQATRYERINKGITNKINKISISNRKGQVAEESYDVQDPKSYLGISEILPLLNNRTDFEIDNWIIGFFNGEVSFTYLTKKNKEIIPRIMLEHTDERVISMIKDRLKIGPKILVRTRDTRKTTYSLQISSQKDITTIITFLDKYNNLRGNKLSQYEEWKEKFKLI